MKNRGSDQKWKQKYKMKNKDGLFKEQIENYKQINQFSNRCDVMPPAFGG